MMPAKTDEADLLRRRLERERAARTEAETIAENSTRELYDISQRLDLILRGAADGICGVDESGDATFVNPAASAMLGRTSAEMVGKPFHDLVHPAAAKKDLCSDQCEILRTLATGETAAAAIDCMYERADGTRFPAECLLRHIGDDPSGRGGVVVVFRDVSERRTADEARQVAADRLTQIERLQEMDRFKTRFINVAAHELNTPMTPTKIQLHLLKTKAVGPLTEQQEKAVDILDRNWTRLSALVQDLLDVARIGEGRLRLRLERVYVDSLVHEAYESFMEEARAKDVTLRLLGTSDAWVVADPRRITQVLYNLLGNALKFTLAGGRIDVSASRGKGEIVVRIADTGVGLTPEQRARLFKPFSQTHEELQLTDSGVGLGLFISKGILDQHKGRIWVESPGAGQGSTFSFSLPLEAPAR